MKIASVLVLMLALAACQINQHTLNQADQAGNDLAVVVFSVSKQSNSAEIMADNGPYMWFCQTNAFSLTGKDLLMSRNSTGDLGMGYRAFSISPGTWSYSHFNIGWGGVWASARNDQVFSFDVDPGEVVYLGSFHWIVETPEEFKASKKDRSLVWVFDDGSKVELFDPNAVFEIRDEFDEAKRWTAEFYPTLESKLVKRLPIMGPAESVAFSPRGLLTSPELGGGEWVCR